MPATLVSAPASGGPPTPGQTAVERPHVVDYDRRDNSKDGFGNKALLWALTRFRRFWAWVQRHRRLERFANNFLVNLAIRNGPTRPSPNSTSCDITCWGSLTDRTYYSRHLPATKGSVEPPEEQVLTLFDRNKTGIRFSDKSTVLFAHFAQWFTDGLLRTDREALARNPPLLKNTSNHEIDLCNLYGLKQAHTDMLRAREGGELKSQWYKSQWDEKEEEWPMFHCDRHGKKRPGFEELPLLIPEKHPLDPDQLERLFAMGTERGNVTPGYAMMNVLFLREHNRVARELRKEYPCWDDDRLFETTRNILIHLLLKIVVEDYINHIAPYHFKFRLYGGQEVKKPWYRTNWVAVEFNLLYRWHSLVPDSVYFGSAAMPAGKAFYRNEALLEGGLRLAFEGAASHRAGHIGLLNTPGHLMRTEAGSLHMARTAQLASFNDYRDAFGFPRVTRFEQISSDPHIVEGLRNVYGRVENVELYVGLFAEDARPNSILAQLMGRMVGVDAFSQALTNPLLAHRVYQVKTFSELGMKIINETKTLNDIVQRNIANPPQVSFTHRTWVHSHS
jgi:prostaglandin-endoperoxide synthase 2